MKNLLDKMKLLPAALKIYDKLAADKRKLFLIILLFLVNQSLL